MLFNVAASLIVAGKASDLKDGVAQAARSIDDGAARAALDKMVDITTRGLPAPPAIASSPAPPSMISTITATCLRKSAKTSRHNEAQRRDHPFSDLKPGRVRRFAARLCPSSMRRDCGGRYGLIAEIKKASPRKA